MYYEIIYDERSRAIFKVILWVNYIHEKKMNERNYISWQKKFVNNKKKQNHNDNTFRQTNNHHILHNVCLYVLIFWLHA